jgi:hypothetical protein
MNARSFSTAFTVDATPAQVYDAINDVRSWWAGELEGNTSAVGDEFTYRYQDMHRSRQRIVELVPGQRVVWHVVEAELNFVDDKNEWTGTEIIFEITRKAEKTELRFTHAGLLPSAECFTDCSSAWSQYINGALRKLILERAS